MARIFTSKQIADLAMAVGIVAHAVELQIHITQSRSAAWRQKSLLLANSIPLGGSLHAVITNLTRVLN